MTTTSKPVLAVHKFSSCDGCQLAFINEGLKLIQLSNLVNIQHFAEAGALNEDCQADIAIIEGSVSTQHDIGRIQKIRANSRYLIAMGACATSGGIQALRNNTDAAGLQQWQKAVYPQHTDIVAKEDLAKVGSIAHHVKVDFEVHGCPVSSVQMYKVVRELLYGVTPTEEMDPVCVSCKHRGVACVTIAKGEPCLGPVTASGCNALCPAIGRGCYGCYGPSKYANFEAMTAKLRAMGLSDAQIKRKYQFINNQQGGFKTAGEAL